MGERVDNIESTGAFRAKLSGAILVMLLAAGCAKPAVDLTEEVGAAGQACAVASDCSSGLQCIQQSCCPDASCTSRCLSLMEKDGTAASAAVSRYPKHRPFLAHKCAQHCCGGADTQELESVLELWSRPANAL